MFLLHEADLATVEEIVIHRQAFAPPEMRALTRDGTERAIRDLASIGVVNLAGFSVYASRAAREVSRLSQVVDMGGGK